jgi:hypothetical protein
LKRHQQLDSSKSSTFNCKFLEISRSRSPTLFPNSILRNSPVLSYSTTSRRPGMCMIAYRKQVEYILRQIAKLSHVAIIVTMCGSRPPCDKAIKWQWRDIQPADEAACLDKKLKSLSLLRMSINIFTWRSYRAQLLFSHRSTRKRTVTMWRFLKI